MQRRKPQSWQTAPSFLLVTSSCQWLQARPAQELYIKTCSARLLTAPARAGKQPDWAALPAELWRHICHQHGQNQVDTIADQPGSVAEVMAAMGKPWVDFWQLVARSSATCRSLRSALLGPHGVGQLEEVLYFQSTYASLAPQPSRGLRCLLQAWSLQPAQGQDLARRSSALNSFVCSQALRVPDAMIWGGGWDLAELQAALVCLRGLKRLMLLDVQDASEAACFSAAITDCGATHISYAGSQALTMPVSVRELEFVCGGKYSPVECRAVFACLAPLSQLTDLYLGLGTMRMTSADFQCLADWLPQLQRLHQPAHGRV